MRIAVIDFETDPFLFGRDPLPFVAGYADDIGFKYFWGADCVTRLCAFLATKKEPMIIYAHNGGKFDFFFMLDEIDNPMLLINGRIVECRLGKHTLRDSFAIIPLPLSAYEKDEIDYAKFEEDVRDQHRPEIIKYLEGDCRYLHKLVSEFVFRFTGKNKRPPLTIGATALKELRKLHPQKLDTSEEHDETFRPYYFGGRVQCFETGVLPGTWKVYDVNSMYPGAMKNYLHPKGSKYVRLTRVSISSDGSLSGFPTSVFFIRFMGKSTGHAPYRDDKGNLKFDAREGEFFLCSHEFKILWTSNLLRVREVIEVHVCMSTQSFAAYVDKYSEEKINAKKIGDKVSEIFSKLLLNSAYGKFAQNPRKFRDHYIEKLGVTLAPDDDPGEMPWKPVGGNEETYRVWARAISELKFNDVAIAASITSASRATLLKGLQSTVRPIYCDTDSVICAGPGNLDLDEYRLGAWKLEAIGDIAYIAGKKMYAIKDTTSIEKKNKGWVKRASKGVILTGDQIALIAAGQAFDHKKDAPTFSIKKPNATYITRHVRKTGA